MVGVVEVEVAFDRAGGVGAGVRVGAGAVVVFLDFRGDSGGAGEHVFGRSSGAGGVVIVDVDARALAVGFEEARALVSGEDHACDYAALIAPTRAPTYNESYLLLKNYFYLTHIACSHL